MVFCVTLFPYAREEGKAKAFIDGSNPIILLIASIIAGIFSFLISGFNGIILMALVAIISYIIAKLISVKLYGLTGDTLGAINEITEVFVLASIVILERSGSWMI